MGDSGSFRSREGGSGSAANPDYRGGLAPDDRPGDRQLGRHGLRPIIFVLNNSGYLSERMLCKDMALGWDEIAAWNYVELPHALGCQGWFTARVSSCGVLDDALKTAEQADGAAYIEVITDAYEAPPMNKKLHEHVESFYNLH